MKTISATHLARNLRQVLDHMTVNGEEIVIERNHQKIARLVPSAKYINALEVMADIYKTLPEDAAHGWEAEGRELATETLADHGVRNPWAS